MHRVPAPACLSLLLLLGACAPASPTATPTSEHSPTATLRPTPTPNPTPIPTPGAISLEPVIEGLALPVGVVAPPDGSGRLFVVELEGRIVIADADGTLVAAPFLDIGERLVAGGEQGLLGFAFHPEFATNGRVFVHYTRTSDGAGIVSEFAASGDAADPASERQLLVVPDPYPNHNGGQLAFGPDGYLYIGLGDGGAGGDPHGNGQNRQTLLGKILRLDVDAPISAGAPYGIPPTNPYASGGTQPGAGLPEIWAYGLRNPWRFSFDRATGDLYIGDVGQGSWEEIDRQPGTSTGGENYGWVVMEGSHCVRLTCDAAGLVLPIAEYGHDQGCSVTGGYVYRGTRQPELVGTYLFGDYCSGRLFGLPAGGPASAVSVLLDTDLDISSFGEGADGEVYVADLDAGVVYRIVSEAATR